MDTQEYNIENFSEENYRKILKLVKDKGNFISYTQFFEGDNERRVIWRHDINFSVHRALKIAEIEKDENVSSVFLYN